MMQIMQEDGTQMSEDKGIVNSSDVFKDNDFLDYKQDDSENNQSNVFFFPTLCNHKRACHHCRNNPEYSVHCN